MLSWVRCDCDRLHCCCLQMRLEYVPVKDIRQLRLEFPLPDLLQYYDSNVRQYQRKLYLACFPASHVPEGMYFPVMSVSCLTAFLSLQPSSYVAHLIGHEGAGSLLSYLRAKGWCNLLEAGPLNGAKGFMFFDVNVDLTEEGEGLWCVCMCVCALQRRGVCAYLSEERECVCIFLQKRGKVCVYFTEGRGVMCVLTT